MKTHWKISIICLLLILGLLLGTQATVKADQLDEGIAAYKFQFSAVPALQWSLSRLKFETLLAG